MVVEYDAHSWKKSRDIQQERKVSKGSGIKKVFCRVCDSPVVPNKKCPQCVVRHKEKQ